MSQWASEVLARVTADEKVKEAESNRKTELVNALLRAAAMWEGEELPQGADGLSAKSATRLLESITGRLPGLLEFLKAGVEFGEIQAAFQLATEVGFPKYELMLIQNELADAWENMQNAKPAERPRGFESSSMGDVLKLCTRLIELGAHLQSLE